MLAQDPWTGQLYDVPDQPNEFAGGYGFPPLAALIPTIGGLVGGLLRPPAPAQCNCGGRLSGVPDYPNGLAGGYGFGPLAALIPKIASAIPAVGNLVGGLLRPPAPPAAAISPPVLPTPAFPLPLPPIPGLPSPSSLLNAIAPGILPPRPGIMPPPVPPGWAPSPYPGAAPPRRLRYMRCAMWPGPPGLVPTAALAPTPVSLVPPPPPGVVPGPPVLMPGGGGFSRRRGGRRRR